MICWKCHEPVKSPVCVGCGTIQPHRADRDHFAILELPRAWHLDLDALDLAWRTLSRLVHPDRFAGRPAVERRMSLQWTAAANEARRVLRDPRLRARFLATGRSDPPEVGGPKPDADFLEEMFDLQMECRADPEGVRARATAMRAALEGELEAIFTGWESGTAALDPFRVEDVLSRLRYVENTLTLASA